MGPSQLINLSPRLPLRVENRDIVHELLVHAIAGVFCWQKPFHAGFSGALDELRLLAHGHKA